MAIYDWVESAATSLDEEPAVRSTRFGDGYEERAPAGLNPVRQRWHIVHRDIDSAVADDIVAFLRARVSAVAGLEPFDWTPLWATEVIRVVCRRWTRTQLDEPDRVDVVATFEQVFEP